MVEKSKKSSKYFQAKKKTRFQKSNLFKFLLHHQTQNNVSNRNVIMDSFSLNFSHKQIIRFKEEIKLLTKNNFLILMT